MRVSLDIPEPKQTLDGSLLRQFADIQRQLMGLMKEQSASGQTLHREWQVAFASQQKTLLGALERLMGIVQKSVGTAHASDGMVEAIRSLRQTVEGIPDDLRQTLDKQYQSQKDRMMGMPMPTVQKVTVQMPNRLLARLDSLEDALLAGLRGSRNRTFGSNY